MIERTCETCSETFQIAEYRLKHVPAKYCSRKCYYRSRVTKVERVCETCGKSFLCQLAYVARGDGRFCSIECRDLPKRNRVERECEWCGAVFMTAPSNLAKGKARFCSQDCHYASKGNRIERECQTCGVTIFVKPSDDKLGWGKFCSKKCMGEAVAGENSPLWKGGITPENERVRGCADYRHWRKDVYVRDDYTCQDCGHRGGYLHAHHIFEFAEYEEHRFAVWNGTTLCKECHLNLHFKSRSAA